MKKLTQANIEQLVDEITAFLEKHHMQDGVCIYFNNKRLVSEGFFDGENLTYKWMQEENMDPHHYSPYAAYDHIISMSFEGSLYDLLNYRCGKLEEQFRAIFTKYGLYYEFGYAWCFTAYPLDDDMEVEYTIYTKPNPVNNLYYHSKDHYITELATIMEAWYQLSKYHGDSGSCVLGAGFSFEYKGDNYFMCACSPYQGSLSWEAHLDIISALLKGTGATNISYHWGNMD
jgi:hypothetical protein